MTVKRFIPLLKSPPLAEIASVEWAESFSQLLQSLEQEQADEIAVVQVAQAPEFQPMDSWIQNLSIPISCSASDSCVAYIDALLGAGAFQIILHPHDLIENPSLSDQILQHHGRNRVLLWVEVQRDLEGEWRIHLPEPPPLISHQEHGVGKGNPPLLPWLQNMPSGLIGQLLLEAKDAMGAPSIPDAQLLEETRLLPYPVLASIHTMDPEILLEIFRSGADGVVLPAALLETRGSLPRLKSALKDKGLKVRI